MTQGALVLGILSVLFATLMPAWPYNRCWGYHPAGVVGIAVMIVLMLMSMGQL